MNRKLGIYICSVASVQLGLYAAAYFDREAGLLFYFDPRIGLFAFESSPADGRIPRHWLLSKIEQFQLQG